MPRLDPEIRVALNGYLRKHHADVCRHWFDDIEPLDIAGGVLRLLVREPVQLRYLQRVCTPEFTEAAQAVTGRLLAVRFVGPDEVITTPDPDDARTARRSMIHSASSSHSDTQSVAVRTRSSTTARPGVRSDFPTADNYNIAVLDGEFAENAAPRDEHTESNLGDSRLEPSAATRTMPRPSLRPSERFGERADTNPSHAGGMNREAMDAGHGPSSGAGHAFGQSSHQSGGQYAAQPSHGGWRPSPGQDWGHGSAEPEGASADPYASLPTLDEQTLLSPDYTFSNFVVGPGNRLALAAAEAVAEKPGRAYNPYFIHGGVGLGKTHLLQAVCQTVLRRNPRARICYISCNTFMDLFHDAVRAGRMSDFRSRFRSVDVLVIDDIHFLSKRDQTQEEFFHTFNALYQAGKQIVLSSDAAPSEIPDLEERLTSRFSCGLVARVDRPCYETRVAIVKSKALMHELELPDDVPAYIAAKIDSNIRELEGALTKIRGLSMALGVPINLDLAKQALSDTTSSGNSGQPSIQMIIEEVSRFFDVKLTDLLSKRRHKSIALPRQVCMWLARKHTRYSLEEIGGYFGGRDHTTVMHAIKTINSKRGNDGKLSADVSRLEEQLLQRVQ